ncbi:MAG: ADP-ribosylglycohydrolase family protein [Ruminococcus sp.]|nr:ADP-ribosylglycohydrolase family protein [Ruminococcus sp.]
MKNLDKYGGCLIGGAAGDALGYAVEFLSEDAILDKYGKNGIAEYKLINGVAQISDDTQMTLFTANGLLIGTTRGMTRGIMDSYPSYISNCYKDWFRTQTEKFPLNTETTYSWLVNIPELFALRAPGNTCLSAINASLNSSVGTIENPINNSKGCGGVMRVAPIGLYFGDKNISAEEIDRIGAKTAALTHGHELGYIPSAALVHIINLVSHNDNVSLLDAVNDSLISVKKMFANAKHLTEFIDIMEKAIRLSKTDMDDVHAIRELGEGWVAEETLAIAVYCALKYENDFDKALIAAVNHSGDSDSTGSVTGNILGAYLGLSNIPQKFKDNLELYDVILEIADDLYNDCKISEYSSYRDEVWEQKYVYHISPRRFTI